MNDLASKLASVAQLGPELYHGSLTSGLTRLKAGAHIGTRQAAVDRIERVMGQSNEQRFPGAAKEGEEAPTLYPVRFTPRSSLEMPDVWWSQGDVVANHLYHQGVINGAERNQIKRPDDYIKLLSDKGYDSIRYINEHEDRGTPSYISLRDLDLGPGAPMGRSR
jgi:hypothetical protein